MSEKGRFISRMLVVWLFAMVFMPLCARSFTVVIDAGHGGKDPGARGARINEKAINLAVALKLGAFIEERSKDVKVVYTRKTDRFVELDERADIANRNKANLFISIHTNAVKRGSSVQGTETYTLGLARTDENLEVAMSENSAILLEDNYKQRYEGFDPNSSESYIIFEFMQNRHVEQSISLASEIQKAFKDVKRVDRGVRQAGFLVLRKTSMPSVLVELGYISNQQEERYLASDEGQRALAGALYQAFVRYKQNYDRRTGTIMNTSSKQTVLSRETDSAHEKAEDASSTHKIAEQIEEDEAANAPVGSEAYVAYRKRHLESKNAAGRAAEKKAQAPAPVQTTARPGKDTEIVTQPMMDNLKNKTVYKVQILTASKLLPSSSSRLKGYKPVGYYVENGIYKYTYGETTSFSEIKQIRKKLLKDFKDAFIVGFKDGKKVSY